MPLPLNHHMPLLLNHLMLLSLPILLLLSLPMHLLLLIATLQSLHLHLLYHHISMLLNTIMNQLRSMVSLQLQQRNMVCLLLLLCLLMNLFNPQRIMVFLLPLLRKPMSHFLLMDQQLPLNYQGIILPLLSLSYTLAALLLLRHIMSLLRLMLLLKNQLKNMEFPWHLLLQEHKMG
jgi:hypothetical protein